jgi:hypothetical protein
MPAVRRATLPEDLRQAQLDKAKGFLAHTWAIEGDQKDNSAPTNLYDGRRQIGEQKLSVFYHAGRVCRLREEISDTRIEDRVKIVATKVAMPIGAECALIEGILQSRKQKQPFTSLKIPKK